MLRIWNRDLQSCFHMLTDLLNPKGSHGCDDFLMTFIKDFAVKYLPDSINLFDKDFNLIKYSVHDVSSAESEGWCIDVVIELSDQSVFIFEIQVYSGSNHIKICAKEVCSKNISNLDECYFYSCINIVSCYNQNDSTVIYLYLNRNDAILYFIGNGLKIGYERKEYIDNLKKWLEHCFSIAVDMHSLKEKLVQFYKLISIIGIYNTNKKNQIPYKLSSNMEYLKQSLLSISYKEKLIEEAIEGPISEALKMIGEMAEKKIIRYFFRGMIQYLGKKENRCRLLKVEFVGYSSFGFEVKHFCYQISYKGKNIWLTYEFDGNGDFEMYYDFSHDTNVDCYPCNGRKWDWGTDWLPDKYRYWNDDTPYVILDELTNSKSDESYFCNLILGNLIKVSTLLVLDSVMH